MSGAWGYATLAVYLVSLGLYGWFLYTNKRLIGRLATGCLSAGLFLHYMALLQRSRALDSVPYQDLYGSLSLFGWLLAATYLGLERFHRQRAVGPFVVPFVVLVLLVATVLEPAQLPQAPPARGTLFALHVTLNVLAYAAFAISFVLSSIYLLQNRGLRGRHPGTVFWRFPALEVLERMSRSGVFVGVVALGFGMALGFVSAHRIQGQAWSADAKEIASISILACYCVYLWLGRTTRWRGARAAVLCVCNFLLVIFSFTVVNVYLSRYHRYF